jgi:hypothetical protein
MTEMQKLVYSQIYSRKWEELYNKNPSSYWDTYGEDAILKEIAEEAMNFAAKAILKLSI